MKKAVAVVLALALLTSVALAEGRSFALNREQGSDIYAWDGAQLTPADTYFSIYSVTNDGTAPEDELFAAQSANQSPPSDGNYAPPRYALLDWKGAQLTGFQYDSLDYDKTADALIYSMNGAFGAMTRSLQELVPCEYDAVVADGEGGFLLDERSDEDAPRVFHMAKGKRPAPTGVRARFYWGALTGGLCSATGEDGYYGYLNGQGKWAIKPRFEWAENFVGDYAVAREKGRTGIISKSGKWAVKPTYDDSRGLLPDGSAAILMRGTRAYFVRPSNGKQVFSIRLSKDGYVSTGPINPVAAVTDRGKTTLYDGAGKAILSLPDSFSFDLYSPLPPDRLLANSTSAAMLLDMDGNALYEGQGLNYLDTVDGRALFTSSRFKARTVQYQADAGPVEEPVYATYRYGIVDADGNELLPPVYRQLYALVSGRYYAQDAKRWGVIDEQGNWIVSGSLYDELMD